MISPGVAGKVGTKKLANGIRGDLMNTASRMESSGEVGQVNISEATYASVKDASTPLRTPAFGFILRGKVQAKGKREMAMYFVNNSPSTNRPEAIATRVRSSCGACAMIRVGSRSLVELVYFMVPSMFTSLVLLELTTTLLGVVLHTVTNMGSRSFPLPV